MIEKLRARGFLGIKRGMNLDEIEIDFTGRSGLIALDGANGRGKTSVLDLLHPFDCLASRDGSLKTHCFLRDSVKELTFTHGGHHYKTLLKIDSESGRSEGYAWKDHSEVSIVKGKISEYHKWAIQEFGSPELFFASIFCAQNSKKISDMTVGTLKSLFVEFLRLERYEVWSDTSKQAANVIDGRAAQMESQITSLLNVINAGTTAIIDDGEAHKVLKESILSKEFIQCDLAQKRNKVDTLKETINKNTLALERKRDLQTKIDQLNQDLAKEKETAAAEINALSVRYREIKAELADKLAFLLERGKIEAAADRQRDLENSLVVLQSAIDRLTGEQSENQGKIHVIETELAALRQSLKTLETDPENLRLGKIIEEAEWNVAEKEKQFRDLALDFQLLALQAEISSLEKAALVGDGIDATCQSVTCAAIKSVNEARERLPVVINSLAVRKSEIGKKEDQLIEEIKAIKAGTGETLNQKEKRIAWLKQWNQDATVEIFAKESALANAKREATAITEQLTANRQQIAKARLEITQQKALADRLPEIQIAEARKTDLEKQLTEVTEQGTARKAEWQRKEASFANQSDLLENRLAEIIIDGSAEDLIIQVKDDIKEIETVKLADVDKEIQLTRDKIAALQAELKQIESAGKELEEVKARRDSLTVEASRWRYLQQACGKNGLQALEIDGAAPLISARANELLAMGYGPQYSIRIDTQDEEGREDLDIKVISEFGEDSLKQKSGGERVWLLHPIRLAMTLLSKEKSGRHWDYAAFDEQDGALDVKGGATDNFMKMYRPFMQIGELKQIFYISHKEVCLSYADHILSFQKGKNPAWS